jgi:WhiB family transcriptional regulator, redox-sensing transcriptional regulator
MSWEDKARCRQYDPEIFFAPRARAERKAKTICGRCPVMNDCLDFALQARVEFGIWGGMNGKERKSLLRRSAGGNDWRVQLETTGLSA